MGCLKISYQSKITVIDEKQIFVDFGYEKNARTKNNCSNYYSGGMLMPNRHGGEYRYGFGGHENDNEVKGKGNHMSFGDYGYDTRLMRRFQIDPMIGEFPWMSPYAVFNNNPIYFADPTGLSPGGPGDEKGACSDADCTNLPTPSYSKDNAEGVGRVNVPESSNWSWVGTDIGNGKEGLDGFAINNGDNVDDATWYWWDSEKNWYYSENGGAYNEGTYNEGLAGRYNPTMKGSERAWNSLYTLDPIKDFNDWYDNSATKTGYWFGYWGLSSYQKGQNDGGTLTGLVEGLPATAATFVMSGYVLGSSLSMLNYTPKYGAFGLNNGYGFKLGSRIEMFYANPNTGGGTLFSYSSKTRIFRLDHHKLFNSTNTYFHKHTAFRSNFTSNRQFKNAAKSHKTILNGLEITPTYLRNKYGGQF